MKAAIGLMLVASVVIIYLLTIAPPASDPNRVPPEVSLLRMLATWTVYACIFAFKALRGRTT